MRRWRQRWRRGWRRGSNQRISAVMAANNVNENNVAAGEIGWPEIMVAAAGRWCAAGRNIKAAAYGWPESLASRRRLALKVARLAIWAAGSEAMAFGEMACRRNSSVAGHPAASY